MSPVSSQTRWTTASFFSLGHVLSPADSQSFLSPSCVVRRPGKSAAGHDFADVLDDDQKRALLECLKTL